MVCLLYLTHYLFWLFKNSDFGQFSKVNNDIQKGNQNLPKSIVRSGSDSGNALWYCIFGIHTPTVFQDEISSHDRIQADHTHTHRMYTICIECCPGLCMSY